MGVAVPQVITSDRASNNQFIDGSLKFDGSSAYLKRTPSSSGDRRTYTFSCWIKRSKLVACGSSGQEIFRAGDSSLSAMNFAPSDGPCDSLSFKADQGGVSPGSATNAVFRDFSAFFHVVYRIDTTQATAANRVRVYVNGVEQTWHTTNYPSEDQQLKFNQSGQAHYIGGTEYFAGYMSQVYLIDGQSLGPENFGFSDGLTNTWKPKKYTGTFTGTNTFYLPFDGNSPIGQDKSGNGNDFTPINFGGSVSLDNPQVSGARPILNTTQGGTQAGLGVFGSLENKYYTVTTANGSVYQFDITSGDNPSLSFIRGATYTFDYSSHSSHPLRFSSTNPDSSTTAYTNGTSVSGNVIKFTVPHNAPDTLYYYCTAHASAMNGSISVTTDETKADPYAWKCTLALPCIGTSNDVSHLINCTTSELPIVDQGDAHADFSTGNFYGGSYDLDNSGDYINVNSSSPYSHVNFGTGDYTAECWVYLEGTGDEYVFNMSTNHGGAAPWWGINFYSTNLIRAGRTNGSGDPPHMKTTTFATNKWMHIAVSRESGTSRLFLDGDLIDTQSDSDDIVPNGNLNIGAYNNGGLELNGFVQDARIYNGVAKYTSSFTPASTNPDILPDTPSGVSGSSKLTKITDGGSVYFAGGNNGPDISWTGTIASTFTLDFYLYVDGTQSAGAGPIFLSDGTDGMQIDLSGSSLIRMEKSGGGSDTGFQSLTGGWNHVRCVVEGTSAGMFINGKSSGTCAPAGGTIGPATLYIGTKARLASSVWFKGYMCNVRIIEAALTGTDSPVIENGIIASSEGGTSAIFLWPGVNSVTENTGSDGDSLTATSSPVLTNFNPFNTDINTVRGRETGYATFNPLDSRNTAGSTTFSDGNLKAAFPSDSGTGQTAASIYVSSGKWYCEFYLESTNDLTSCQYGLVSPGSKRAAYIGASGTGDQYGWEPEIDRAYTGGTNTTPTGKTFTSQWSVAAMALDLDAGTWEMFIDGVATGTIYSGISGTYTFAIGDSMSSGYHTHTANFGQKPFKFPPPDGFQPLNTANARPETVISRPDQYVGIVTYIGSGSTSGREISGLNFNAKPDLIWIKNRGEDIDHILFDSLRGFGANKELTPNDAYSEGQTGTGAPNTQSWGFVKSNNTNGFTVQSGSSGQSVVNNSSINYVAWCWRAGGDAYTYNKDYTGGSSASDIGISATTLTLTGASINTKSKFGMYTYTGSGSGGATITHGLGGTPAFVIYKKRTGSSSWQVYHQSLGGTKYINLDQTDDAFTSDSTRFGGTDPTSTTITLGTHANGAGTVVLYAWCDVPGLQKFGSFTGNASADGPYVELGFRPSLIILKNSSDDQNWFIYDATRNPNNPSTKYLRSNLTSIEYSISDGLDFLSNGFKMRQNSASHNGSGNTIIYMAWAEAPSIDLYGGGANAR